MGERASAAQDDLPEEGQREGLVRREITKGGVGGGKQTNMLWKAEAEMQIVNKNCRIENGGSYAGEAGRDH